VTIKAIETRYAGCHFRSRLEARWAVFFDHLGVRWEYEPEGFEWEAGEHFSGQVPAGRYLPDFWLPDINTWFEVKGQLPTNDESELHWAFSTQTSDRLLVAWGTMPSRRVDDWWGFWDGDEISRFPTHGVSIYIDGCWDDHYVWCVCPICDKVGIEFDGRGERVCHRDAHSKPRMNKTRTHQDARFDRAFAAARSARFEHGCSGAS
jgi:hypothetical protein